MSALRSAGSGYLGLVDAMTRTYLDSAAAHSSAPSASQMRARCAVVCPLHAKPVRNCVTAPRPHRFDASINHPMPIWRLTRLLQAEPGLFHLRAIRAVAARGEVRDWRLWDEHRAPAPSKFTFAASRSGIVRRGAHSFGASHRRCSRATASYTHRPGHDLAHGFVRRDRGTRLVQHNLRETSRVRR